MCKSEGKEKGRTCWGGGKYATYVQNWLSYAAEACNVLQEHMELPIIDNIIAYGLTSTYVRT